LPTTSARSLTRLSIVLDESCTSFLGDDDVLPTPLWPTSLLDPFENLNSLSVSPLTDIICEFIVRAVIALTDFRTRVVNGSAVTAEKVVDIFSAPSLRNLRCLRFAVDVCLDEFERSWYLRLLETITTNLDSLEELYLAIPLDLSWCDQISRLRKLNMLVWWFPVTACYNSEDILFGADYKRSTADEYKQHRKLVARAFDAAFEPFASKPHIELVAVNERALYRISVILMTRRFQNFVQKKVRVQSVFTGTDC